MAPDAEDGAVVHLPFQELRARDPFLALSVAPRQLNAGPDGGVVGEVAAGETAQRAVGAGSGRIKQGVEAGAGLATDESDEGPVSVVNIDEVGLLPHACNGRSLRRAKVGFGLAQ